VALIVVVKLGQEALIHFVTILSNIPLSVYVVLFSMHTINVISDEVAIYK